MEQNRNQSSASPDNSTAAAGPSWASGSVTSLATKESLRCAGFAAGSGLKPATSGAHMRMIRGADSLHLIFREIAGERLAVAMALKPDAAKVRLAAEPVLVALATDSGENIGMFGRGNGIEFLWAEYRVVPPVTKETFERWLGSAWAWSAALTQIDRCDNTTMEISNE